MMEEEGAKGEARRWHSGSGWKLQELGAVQSRAKELCRASRTAKRKMEEEGGKGKGGRGKQDEVSEGSESGREEEEKEGHRQGRDRERGSSSSSSPRTVR